MEVKPTPRINSSLLSSHLNQTVRLACKIISVRNGIALAEASDQGQVTIRMHPATPPYTSQCIEVVGREDGDLSIQELSVVELGDHFGILQFN